MTAKNVNPELVRQITDGEHDQRSWGLELNGEYVEHVSQVRLFNEKMGVEVQYGMRAEGYDGVVIHEPGGGGSVLVPYVVYDVPHMAFADPPSRDILWIGLLEQERKLQGVVPILNLPRGFLDPGETHFETAVREFKEETGREAESNRIQDLCEGYSSRGNANSAFFDTSRYTQDDENEGVQYYAVEFHSDEVYMINLHPDDPPVLAFKKDAVRAVENNPDAERIFSCYFYPWDVAAGVADQFTNSGVARLLSYLIVHSGNFSLLTQKFVSAKLL